MSFTQSSTALNVSLQHVTVSVRRPAVPEFLGGSADLTPSNLTRVDGNSIDYSRTARDGRYLRFGVREHGMCAVVNGIAGVYWFRCEVHGAGERERAWLSSI